MESTDDNGAHQTIPKRDSAWSGLAENISPLRTIPNYDCNIDKSPLEGSGNPESERTYLLKVWQGRERLRIRVEELEALVERCYLCVRALKEENQQLREEADAHQAAYLESQDTLEHLLHNVELYIKNPAGYQRLRMDSTASTEIRALLEEWDHVSWISVGDNEATFSEIWRSIETSELFAAGEKIDIALRKAQDAFLQIDLRLIKSSVLRGLSCTIAALQNTEEAIRICEELWSQDKLQTDDEINYLAKTKWFQAKCLLPSDKTAAISAALQSAAVVRGSSSEVAKWRCMVATEGRKHVGAGWSLDDDMDLNDKGLPSAADNHVSVSSGHKIENAPTRSSFFGNIFTNTQKAIPGLVTRAQSPTRKKYPRSTSPTRTKPRSSSFGSIISSFSSSSDPLSDEEIADRKQDFDINEVDISSTHHTPRQNSEHDSNIYSTSFWDYDEGRGIAGPSLVSYVA